MNSGQSSEADFAGVRVRYLALVVDLVFLSAVFFPVTRLVKGTWIMSPDDHRWAYGWFITDPMCLAFLGVMVGYFVLFEGLLCATPGKRLLRLRVICTDGRRPGLTRSVVRNALRVVDGLPALGILGAVLITVSRERMRFGDRVAHTRVVHHHEPGTNRHTSGRG